MSFILFHYVPLHSAPMARKLGLKMVHLPVTDRVSEQLLRLPYYFGLETDTQYRIVQLLHDFFVRG